LWCTTKPLYTPGLALFGLTPSQVIFVEKRSDKEALWALEEGLLCAGLSVVVSEDVSLTPKVGRRLQLAARKSGVTALVLLKAYMKGSENVAMTRWQVRPASSAEAPGRFKDDGVGDVRFKLRLMRCRGGVVPQAWTVEWNAETLSFNLVSGLKRTANTQNVEPMGQALYAHGGAR
jgi:protein ImuA